MTPMTVRRPAIRDAEHDSTSGARPCDRTSGRPRRRCSIDVVDYGAARGLDDDRDVKPADRDRLGPGMRTPSSIPYGKRDLAAVQVEDADVDDLRVEDLVDLVAHQVVHRLHVELGGEALLDAVDDRQLGRALVGLSEQSLRLVEQARVLEGHAQAAARVASSRSSRSLNASSCSRFSRAMTPDRAARDDRHAQPRLRSGLAGDGGRVAPASTRPRTGGRRVDDDRATSDRSPSWRIGSVGKSLASFDRVRERAMPSSRRRIR